MKRLDPTHRLICGYFQNVSAGFLSVRNISVAAQKQVRMGIVRVKAKKKADVTRIEAAGKICRGSPFQVLRAGQELGRTELVGHDLEYFPGVGIGRDTVGGDGVDRRVRLAAPGQLHGIMIVVITRPEAKGKADLFQIIDTLWGMTVVLPNGHGENQRRHYDKRCNKHEQFDQGKSAYLNRMKSWRGGTFRTHALSIT